MLLGNVKRAYRFNRCYKLAALVPHLVNVAARTPPLPHRLLTLAGTAGYSGNRYNYQWISCDILAKFLVFLQELNGEDQRLFHLRVCHRDYHWPAEVDVVAAVKRIVPTRLDLPGRRDGARQ